METERAGKAAGASDPSWLEPGTEPTVTVAVPVRNEAERIEACLAGILAQDYRGIVEVLVVDGASTDETAALARRDPRVEIVENPLRSQAAGLNLAIERARGDVFVRVDARTRLEPDYVRRCIEALLRTGAVLVGGAQVPVAMTSEEEPIARAMGSHFGAGPARHRRGDGPAGWTDMVYLLASPTAALRAVGGFDERFRTNEDTELALRLAELGGIWFDPSIVSAYRPRGSLVGVARQFLAYGRGRAATAVQHPQSLLPRQLAAPCLVVALCIPWRQLRWPVGAGYAVAVVGLAITQRDLRWSQRLRMALAFPAMHLGWGAGFLLGLPKAVARHRGGPACRGAPGDEG